MTYSRPCVQAIRVLAILPSSNKCTVFGKIIATKPPVGDLVRGSVHQNAPRKNSLWNWPRLLGGGLAREFSQNPKICPDLSSFFYLQKRICPSDALTMGHEPTRHSDPWGQRRPEIVGSWLVSNGGWNHP